MHRISTLIQLMILFHHYVLTFLFCLYLQVQQQASILEVALVSLFAELGITMCYHIQLLVLKNQVVLLFPFLYLTNSIFLRMCHSLQSYTQLILKRTTQKRAPKASYSFPFQLLTIKLRTVMLEVENHRSFIFYLSQSELSM